MTTPDVERLRWAVAACKLWVAQDEMPVRHELLTALRWVLEHGCITNACCCDEDGNGRIIECEICQAWREYRDAVGVSDDR